MFKAVEIPIILASTTCLFMDMSKSEKGVPAKIVTEDQINIWRARLNVHKMDRQ